MKLSQPFFVFGHGDGTARVMCFFSTGFVGYGCEDPRPARARETGKRAVLCGPAVHGVADRAEQPLVLTGGES